MQRHIKDKTCFGTVPVLLTTIGLLAGTLLAADARLDYIESTGTQYIDTGVTGATDDYTGDGLVVEADIMWTDFTVDANNPWETLIGAQNNSSKTIAPIRAARSSSSDTGITDVCFDNSSHKWKTGVFCREGLRCTLRAVLATGANSLSSDGLEYYTDAGTPLSTDSSTFYIFAENVKGSSVRYPAWARCYGLKIWKNGELVRDFIPVRRESDDAIGLYDLVGETFYGNVGTGAFIAGPVSSEPECRGITKMVGGETTMMSDNSELHVFTNSGTLTVTGNGTVDVLVVGGGGGGGMAYGGGGGGGGGGVIYRQNLIVTGGVYTVTVGAGGHGPTFAETQNESSTGGSGEDSSVFGLVAIGGGGGGNTWGSGNRGGCGGGAGATLNNTVDGAIGCAGQGFHGGGSSMTSAADKGFAGGGGGAGGAPANAVASSSTWGVGGAGRLCSITGEDKYYGGGGGGGTTRAYNQWTPGGIGGGGRGGSRKNASENNAGEAGTPNTGGGGGGGGHLGGVNPVGGGDGGSGIVIVRYTPKIDEFFDEVTAVGATRRHDGDYDVYTFANAGAASSFTVKGNSLVDVLIVGGCGGGGAGYASGGGGGGGGVIYKQNLLVMEGAYEISVGGGGPGGKANANRDFASYSGAGTNSTAFGFVAHGGGRGGNTSEAGGGESATGEKAGSGGGAAGHLSNTVFKRVSGGDRTAGQGNFGGWSTNVTGWTAFSGGGGGAGEDGHDGVSPKTDIGGKGGDGIACSITGEEKYYGGGGGGGTTSYCNVNTAGIIPGGLGGGGRGNGRNTADKPQSGTNGEPGTGGGGGGAGAYPSKTGDGGNGGSGIVIIRCHRVRPGFLLIFK